jgi:hypothetical protein
MSELLSSNAITDLKDLKLDFFGILVSGKSERI